VEDPKGKKTRGGGGLKKNGLVGKGGNNANKVRRLKKSAAGRRTPWGKKRPFRVRGYYAPSGSRLEKTRNRWDMRQVAWRVKPDGADAGRCERSVLGEDGARAKAQSPTEKKNTRHRKERPVVGRLWGLNRGGTQTPQPNRGRVVQRTNVEKEGRELAEKSEVLLRLVQAQWRKRVPTAPREGDAKREKK